MNPPSNNWDVCTSSFTSGNENAADRAGSSAGDAEGKTPTVVKKRKVGGKRYEARTNSCRKQFIFQVYEMQFHLLFYR